MLDARSEDDDDIDWFETDYNDKRVESFCTRYKKRKFADSGNDSY